MTFPILHDPPDLENIPAWCTWIPLAGWMIGYHRQLRNERKLVRQAVDRGPVPASAWAGLAYDSEIRETIERIVKDFAYGEAATFHPDDPFELMCVLRYGDLNELDIIMGIEKAFGVTISEPIMEKWIDEKTTFVDTICWIEKERKK